MPDISLDPRIQRADLEASPASSGLAQNEEWETFAIFHQDKRGSAHEFVGIVHAPDPELALLFAKEQFGRRKKTVNLWAVRSTDIFTFQHEDDDMFSTIPDKNYREASGYPVRKRINKYLDELKDLAKNKYLDMMEEQSG
jgi:ring-1,2-phenylacetyl-CoA epoxidase subunit PaaB